jgi:hypothetical protein
MTKIKYEEIKKFVVDYCRDYTAYAQDKKSMPKMNKYWLPDIKVTAYMQLKGGKYPLKLDNRDKWQKFLIDGHVKILEELIPVEIMIDMKQMKVGVVLCIKKYSRKDNMKLRELDGFGYYSLIIDDSNSLKIKTLDFYTGDPQTFTSLYNI